MRAADREGILMAIAHGNIFANIPVKLRDEQFIELLSVPNLRIERIVSIGHSSSHCWKGPKGAECQSEGQSSWGCQPGRSNNDPLNFLFNRADYVGLL
jgi:hypothetical protein